MAAILRRVLRWCHLFSAVPILALVLITTADVIARYFLASSVRDTAEISGMLLGVSISLSLAFTTFRQEQVRFDLVVSRLPGRVRTAADILTFFVSAALFGLIAWQTLSRVLYSMRSGEYVGEMEIPVWPAKAVFAAGCFLTALGLVALFIAAVGRIAGGGTPPEEAEA
jgi:TRAP-type mannitol/chloroaromatic compound transport system permease small subunit